MPNRSSKTRDINKFVKFVVDLSTGNPITEDISPIAEKAKNPAGVESGKLGGLKAGTPKKTGRKRTND